MTTISLEESTDRVLSSVRPLAAAAIAVVGDRETEAAVSATLVALATPEIEARFWAQVIKGPGPDDCWRWAGKSRRVYGGHAGPVSPRRFAWERDGRILPEGMVLQAVVCGNPACVRPSHAAAARPGQAPSHGDGRQHPNARLTDVQVLDIRARYAAGETQMALARAFGVARETIWSIVHGASWKHLLPTHPKRASAA